MQSPRPEGSQARILDHLKRRGEASVPKLADVFGVSVETVRSQVKALVAQGWVEQVGTRRDRDPGAARRRGRPEQVFGLADVAEELFPRREAEVLTGLAEFLSEEGEQDLLARFMDRFAEERKLRALTRVEGMNAAERLDEAARILTEEGYMAEVVEGGAGEALRLRLCHCPLRDLVRVTAAPCRAEVGFVRALVGDKLARVEYLPDGDGACTYAIGASARGR